MLEFSLESCNSYLFANRKEILKFKADDKNVNVSIQFFLCSISKGFGETESREVFLKASVYDFSVIYNAINKSDK